MNEGARIGLSSVRWRRVRYAPASACAVLLVGLLVATAAPPPAAQAGVEQDAGVVAGTVVNQAGAPVAGATIEVRRNGRAIRTSRTDQEGAFALTDMVAGTYEVVATHLGYADGAYGRRWPGGTSRQVRVADGQAWRNLTIAIWEFAVVAGSVVDERGEPLPGVTVEALRRRWSLGRLELDAEGTDETDDRGEYRIAELVPGDYVIGIRSTRATFASGVASSNVGRFGSTLTIDDEMVFQTNNLPLLRSADGGVAVYDAAYHPAAETPGDASVVHLSSGGTRNAVDLALRVVPSWVVRGTARDAAGAPASFAEVSLVRPLPNRMWAQAGVVVTRTTADSDGRFSMRGVPAGTYRLVASRIPMTRSVSPAMQAEIALLQAIGGQRLPSSARRLPPPPGVSTLWVTADLVVGTGDVTQDLAMGEAPRVEGQVLTDEGVQLSPGQLESIAVTLLPAESAFLLRIFPDRVAPDGRFMTTGSPPGRHFLRFDGLPDGHYVSSVVHRDREYRDAPLDLSTGSISGVELWISNQPLGTVKGSVMWRGIPDENALVVVFPETARNPMAWVAQRVGDSASGPGGTFEVDGLLPGDYLAAAIPLERGDGWQDPDMLERLRAGAQRVSLQQGQSVSVSLVRPAG